MKRFKQEDVPFREGCGQIKFTPQSHWKDAVAVYYDANPRRGDGPLVEINWSCYGGVSIEEAEDFLAAFKAAVRAAKRKAAEL